MASSDSSVTDLLLKWRTGDAVALANLTTALYRELRAMARDHVRRERLDHTLQGTGLVNEVFMRLVKLSSVDVRDRAHFMALASTIMRRILVDHARARLASKRGGGVVHLSSDALDSLNPAEDPDTAVSFAHDEDALLVNPETNEDIAALDELLTRLQQVDSRSAQIVEMRYFGGLTIEQTAEALGISDATVKREWSLARAWLAARADAHRRMNPQRWRQIKDIFTGALDRPPPNAINGSTPRAQAMRPCAVRCTRCSSPTRARSTTSIRPSWNAPCALRPPSPPA